MSYQSLMDRFASFGTICAMFVPPDYVCSGERVDHRAQVHAWAVSLPITVLRTSKAEVALVVGESSQAMKSTESGRSSDRVRHADKVFRGLVLGTDVSFAPFPHPRARAFVSAGTTNLNHFRHLHIADGYTPFEQPIRVWSVQLGLEWSR